MGNDPLTPKVISYLARPSLLYYPRGLMGSPNKPLIYSCSGCSNIAQVANQVAIELDRQDLAEMSCIAGVGGGVKSLVKQAQNAQHIIALDGCALHCVKSCLANHQIQAHQHYTLTDYGIKKRKHFDYDSEDVKSIKILVITDLKPLSTF